MTIPNTLSRQPDYDLGGGDNQEQTLLPDDLFHVWRLDSNLATENPSLLDCIRQSPTLEDKVSKALGTLLAKGPKAAQHNLSNWEVKDGLTIYREKIYVPKDTKLCRDLVKSYHDSTITGHSGCFKTSELIQRTFWWPGLTVFVKKLRNRMCNLPKHKDPNAQEKHPNTTYNLQIRPEPIPNSIHRLHS
jgi:hypothetical protein